MVTDPQPLSNSTADYFSEVRHGIKNHMSVVLAFTQLIEVELAKLKGDKSTIESYLEKISKRAHKVVDQVDIDLSEDVATRLK
jgi:hypothetical protein